MNKSLAEELMLMPHEQAFDICRGALERKNKPTEDRFVAAAFIVLTASLHQPGCVFSIDTERWHCLPTCPYHD